MPLPVQQARLAATVSGGASVGARGAEVATPTEERREEAIVSEEERLEDAALSRAAELKRAEATLERVKAEVREEFTLKLPYSAAHGLLELPFVEKSRPGSEPVDTRAICRVAASLEKGYVEAARRFGFELSGQLLRDLRRLEVLRTGPSRCPAEPRPGSANWPSGRPPRPRVICLGPSMALSAGRSL